MVTKGERMIQQERRMERLKMINDLLDKGYGLVRTCEILSKKLGLSERTLKSFYQRNKCVINYTHLPVVVKASKNEIIKIYKEGDSIGEIADLFGFEENQIQAVIRAYKKTKKEKICLV